MVRRPHTATDRRGHRLYLASVLDLASRRLAGFALDQHYDAQLAVASLDMAVAVRGGDAKRGNPRHRQGPTPHSLPRCSPWPQHPRDYPSLGRVGSCFDNVAVESWHSTLEFECSFCYQSRGSPGRPLHQLLQRGPQHSTSGMLSRLSGTRRPIPNWRYCLENSSIDRYGPLTS